MDPPEQELQYHTYVVRCWKERSAQPSRHGLWRFSLEDPRTNTRHGFTSFAALAEFLHRTIGVPAETPGARDVPGDCAPAKE